MGVERYQLIIFVVVVVALFVLGVLLGRWLATLAPTLSDAIDAAFAWVGSLFTGTGVVTTPTGRTGGGVSSGSGTVECQTGQTVVNGRCEWPVIDVFPDSGTP